MTLMAQKNKAWHKSDKEEGVLLHNGKKFAVGMTWLTADDELDIKLAKDRAQKMEADFYALRSTVSTQQGFGSLRMGHRAGMPSAASLASDMLVGEWHGVFAADNGWWYVAVHADAIAPDGDVFFFSEEQAYQHFQERASDYKWPRTYVPESWNLPDTSAHITLDKLLEDVDRSAVLRAANLNALFGGAKQKSMALLVAALFIGFLLVAFIAPSLFSSDRPDLNALVRNRIPVPGRIFAPPPLPRNEQLAQVDLSSLQAARPSVLINACASAFERLVRPLPGWDFNGITCAANNQARPMATGLWQRRSGSLETLRPALAAFPDGVTMTFNGSNQISAQSAVGDLRNIVKPLELGVRERIIATLTDRFGALGRLTIKDIRPPAPPPPRGVEGLVEQEQPPAPPPYMEMALVTQTPPNMIAGYFDVSGVKVQTVQWSKRSGTWTYTAEIQYDSKALREYYAYQQRQREKR